MEYERLTCQALKNAKVLNVADHCSETAKRDHKYEDLNLANLMMLASQLLIQDCSCIILLLEIMLMMN